MLYRACPNIYSSDGILMPVSFRLWIDPTGSGGKGPAYLLDHSNVDRGSRARTVYLR